MWRALVESDIGIQEIIKSLQSIVEESLMISFYTLASQIK